MTRERAKEMLTVIQAWAEGGEIEVRGNGGDWEAYGSRNHSPDPNFNNENWLWRVKPEPREFWAVDRGEGITGLFYRSRKDAEELNPGFRPFRVREVL